MESLYGKCYDSLQEKLEKEKENLKHVEENIKKIIGRNVVDSGRQVR
jgi:pinin/SDK conserved region.